MCLSFNTPFEKNVILGTKSRCDVLSIALVNNKIILGIKRNTISIEQTILLASTNPIS